MPFCFVTIAALAWLLAEVCYAIIVAVARLPHCLLARGPLLVPPAARASSIRWDV